LIDLKKAENFINSLKIYEEYVVLACSYGPDSMALLDLLQKAKLNIVVAHINHKLRVESDEERNLLEAYCQENNLVFESIEINEYPKGNIEKNARDIRYKYFKKMLKKYRAKYLFTAHHGDDLIETIMMRLIRGAAFKGYGGFEKLTVYPDYSIARPLIFHTKDEINKYIEDKNLSYAIDQTNFTNSYTRNRLRNEVLPLLKKENKNVHKKFLKFNEMINEYEAYFYRECDNLYLKLYKNDRLDINEFGLLDIVMQKRLLNQILLNIYCEKIDLINDEHVNFILNLAHYDRQNTYIMLPNNLKVAKFYNMLIFNYHEKVHNNYCYTIKNNVNTPFGKIIKVEESDDTSNFTIRLDSRELRLPLQVRSRKKGDKIAVKNLQGTKKIKDILIDVKLQKDLRDTYPIVTDNDGQILWIPGIKKSKNDKQIEETYDIILEYVKEGKKDENK